MAAVANGVRKSTLVRAIARSERRVSSDEVLAAIGRSSARRLQLICLDRHYFALPTGLWNTVLRYTGVDQGQYRAERYDCDDFATAFKAAVSRKLAVNGVGLVVDISGAHAYNALLGLGLIQRIRPWV